jgi:hypothetical protein
MATYLIELHGCKGAERHKVASMLLTKDTVDELLRDSGLIEYFEECTDDQQPDEVRTFELQYPIVYEDAQFLPQRCPRLEATLLECMWNIADENEVPILQAQPGDEPALAVLRIFDARADHARDAIGHDYEKKRACTPVYSFVSTI